MSKIRKPCVSSKDNAEQLLGTRKSFSRRSLLKSAVGAAVGATAAGFAGTIVRARRCKDSIPPTYPRKFPWPSAR